MERNKNSKPSRCPQYGADEIMEIVYGLPGPEMIPRSMQDEIILGGCCISDNSPRWHCDH